MHFPSRPILRLVRDHDEPSGLKVLPTREGRPEIRANLDSRYCGTVAEVEIGLG